MNNGDDCSSAGANMRRMGFSTQSCRRLRQGVIGPAAMSTERQTVLVVVVTVSVEVVNVGNIIYSFILTSAVQHSVRDLWLFLV